MLTFDYSSYCQLVSDLIKKWRKAHIEENIRFIFITLNKKYFIYTEKSGQNIGTAVTSCGTEQIFYKACNETVS